MENTQNIKDLIQKFYPYAKEALDFEHPVRVVMRQDAENAKNSLGKTAYYDPAEKIIVLYVTGRHPKDILRSFSHELVHHAQNCRGDLDDLTTDGHYAKDGKGREIEEEAYLQGNLNLRDYEDQLKFKGMDKMKITKEELKNIIFSTIEEMKEGAKPDFLDLDKDGDKEETMKKAAKDKKEKVDEVDQEDAEEELAAAQKLAGEFKKDKKKEKKKFKPPQPDRPAYPGDTHFYGDDPRQFAPPLPEGIKEEKQVVTETPQQPKEVKETNKAWYNTSLYDKLKSKWTK